MDGYICGMTWGFPGVYGTWNTPEARRSMAEVAKLNVNWVILAFAGLQDTAQSTTIQYNGEPVVTDEEIVSAISEAKRLGLNVCLKPMVNCKDGTWRAHINFFDQDVPGEPTWSEWFASYNAFILHYARMAEETGCEMLCIGCEMVQADKREREWRALIAEVRDVYSGPVTYNCDKYQEDRLTWWDAVDVISASGYYPSGSWQEQLDRIEPVVKKHGKPFFFIEAGCPSRIGSSARPNDWTMPGGPSEDEQDAWYREMFAETEKREWVQGFGLWDWKAQLYDPSEAEADRDYSVYAKKAGETVRLFYGRKREKGG